MNNNDQQLNDNYKEVPAEPQKSAAETIQETIPEEASYEYVFSNGSVCKTPESDNSHADKKTKRGAKKFFLRVGCVTLGVILAFAAGFGGALCANRFANSDNSNGTEKDLYHENPEEILPKDPSSPSQYGSAGEDVFSVSQVANVALDTVVVVEATIISSSFREETISVSTGSGVIITENGYIVTCHHVIEGASEINITLNSGKTYPATLVGSDNASDIALLYISAEGTLPFAKLGNSGDLILGESVVAIGNPLGTLYRTVTTGVISGLNRKVATDDGYVMTLLQTDAAVNSGNSGGGLFNLDGELIGIVNAKYAKTGVEGLAFAIPIDWAYEVQLDLMEYGYVRGMVDHGLTVVEVNESNFYSYALQYGIRSYGVYVVDSVYCTDLQNKDRIVSINGTEISTQAQLNAICRSCKVGDTIEIVYSRGNENFTTTTVLQEYVPDHIKSQQK